jgi:hypothetical protein
MTGLRIRSALTIFAVPKPFEGHIGMIQRNAIRSWKGLRPDRLLRSPGTNSEHPC